MTPFSNRFLASIKTATKHAVEAIGDFRAAAGFTRVQKSQLEAYASRHQPTVIPLDVAIDLDRCAEQPILLSEMANAEGFALVPVKFGSGPLPHDMGKFAKATSEVLQKGFESMADGNVDVQEAQEILTYAQRARTSLHHIESTAHKIIAEGKPLQVTFPQEASGS
ncbi:hypothetical protein FKW31_10050 [Acetobacter sp. DmW_136]|uniref:hypothetical protein n=1 Tax=Acetobacter sp. DmW_136 TaxID=2591091 RepID=UPI001238B90E|nr:hypothetical protein [Acetobacter sp. DmW_136]KAA8385144.1 hypothetical protein FKW31_10050 [Acetobacter sp. DmW_136]